MRVGGVGRIGRGARGGDSMGGCRASAQRRPFHRRRGIARWRHSDWRTTGRKGNRAKVSMGQEPAKWQENGGHRRHRIAGSQTIEPVVKVRWVARRDGTRRSDWNPYDGSDWSRLLSSVCRCRTSRLVRVNWRTTWRRVRYTQSAEAASGREQQPTSARERQEQQGGIRNKKGERDNEEKLRMGSRGEGEKRTGSRNAGVREKQK